MKRLSKSYAGIFLISIFFFSCNKDNNSPTDQNKEFKQGVFVVDEGNYSDADGEVTFINFATGDVWHNVFKYANNRPFAGVLQSLTIYKGKGYLVDQLGRLEAVDAVTFHSEGTLTDGLTIPRYFTADNGKGYISDWGPYDADYNNPHSKIIVVDLAGLGITDSIQTYSRPEGVLVSGGHLFVANSGTDIVSVYNTDGLNEVAHIQVSPGPTLLETDKNGYIWTVCSGNDSVKSAIVKIDPDNFTAASTITLPEGIHLNGKMSMNGAGDKLYVMSEQWATDYSYADNTVFSQPVDQGSFSFTSVISRKNLYGLGVDPDQDNIYVSDAAGFQSNGTIFAYSSGGALLDSAQVDRGPRDFVFVNEQ